jgi:hypothetical protein
MVKKMMEMDYRTTEEIKKDQIIEETLRDVRRTMENLYKETKDLKEIEYLQTRIKQILQ